MRTRRTTLVLSAATIALAGVLAVSGCGRQAPIKPPTSPPAATQRADTQSLPTATAPPTTTQDTPVTTLPPTRQGQPPSPQPTGTAPSQNTPVAALQITSPQDESVVTSSPVTVKGTAPLDATVSVNDDVVDIAEDGTFSANVGLQEGPNFIEVVASDFNGNESSRVITVMYIP